MVFIVVFCIL